MEKEKTPVERLHDDIRQAKIAVVDFDHSDVVRHPLVSKIVRAYNNNDKS